MRLRSIIANGTLMACALCVGALLVFSGCRNSATSNTTASQHATTVAAPSGNTLPRKRINPKDGAEMVLVPAGEFLMGTSEKQLTEWLKANPGHRDYVRSSFTEEMPQHPVYLDAYYIYKTEVTVAQYRSFCEATGRQMPPNPKREWQDNYPMVDITWEDANAYAQWAGASLPTEAQWERAARGTDGRVYPWGNDWDTSKCNNLANPKTSTKILPVGSFPASSSPDGCLDMVGSTMEWCSDWFDKEYYKHSPSRNPTGPPTGEERVYRGCSRLDIKTVYFRTTTRRGVDPDYESIYMGFRCVVISTGP